MKISHLRIFVLVTIVLLSSLNVFALQTTAAPSSSYYYRFTVNDQGFTNVEVDFTDTSNSGSSWVIVPKFSSWSYSVTPPGSIISSENVSTRDLGFEEIYFYKAFKFSYRSTSSFNMKVQFDFENGALIIEKRGIFFSPQIGYEQDGSTSGKAEVLFDSHLTVEEDKVQVAGTQLYPGSVEEIDLHRVLFNLPRNKDLLRLQVEFKTSLSTQYTTLTSNNQVFTFRSPNPYASHASSILNLFDTLYNNYTRLLNVTLTPEVDVQFFLPKFDEFLSVGGFVPFSAAGAGEISVNIFFIRAVNGTIEVIATHELVHHFLIEAEISPNVFLWFHEGMAEYLSVTFVETLGYEGAKYEKDTLENGAAQLIQWLGREDFSFLEDWNPSASPNNVGNYYAASYYVVSRLAQEYGGLDFYKRFFELIHGVDVDNIDVLTLYMSMAANAPVAFTLQDWGFSVADLYTSPEISEKIVETQRAIANVNPVFQPYKSLAEFFYKQAWLSFRRGDTTGGTSLLQIAIIIANLAPFLTLLTIAAVLGIIVYLLRRHSKRAKLKPPVPPPPPEIFSKSTE